MTELKRCPWCKQKPRLQLTDHEGNWHDESYLNEPYSGIGYVLVHESEELSCPIATSKGEHLGQIIFYDKQDAVDTWNGWGEVTE